MTLESDIGCLKSIPLFRGLPGPRLKLLALMGERLYFPAGTVITEEGNRPEEVYCLLEGEVELRHERADGSVKSLRLASGSLIGDVPLLCNQPNAARATAMSDVTALRLPRTLFFELLDNIPEFSVALSRDLAGRLYRLANSVLHEETPS